jgi:hypothetical protein
MKNGPTGFWTSWIDAIDDTQDGADRIATKWFGLGPLPLLPLRRAVIRPEFRTVRDHTSFASGEKRKVCVGYEIVSRHPLHLRPAAFVFLWRWLVGFPVWLVAATVVLTPAVAVIALGVLLMDWLLESDLWILNTCCWLMTGFVFFFLTLYTFCNIGHYVFNAADRVRKTECQVLRRYALATERRV